MTIWATIRTLVIGAILLAPFSAVHAVIVDFTSDTWDVGQNITDNFTADGITLSSAGGNMTFNGGAGEIAGCVSTPNTGPGSTGLACAGDGIGIGNDEITEGGSQTLTVTFDEGPVNVHAIHFLDLFSQETKEISDRDPNGDFGEVGEVAVIQWLGESHEAWADESLGLFNDGGYWEVNFPVTGGLTMAGITEFTLTGFSDNFSDYSLARIEFSAVPVPAAFWMFGTALIGFVAFSRRTKV